MMQAKHKRIAIYERRLFRTPLYKAAQIIFKQYCGMSISR